MRSAFTKGLIHNMILDNNKFFKGVFFRSEQACDPQVP
jgi:hypothetical protein